MPKPIFHERFELVLRWLQRRHAYIAAAVMRLGRIQISEAIPTAAIVAHERDVWLYFNPEFLGRIDNAELAGVLTHEALHFAFAHPKRLSAIHNQCDRFYFGLACEAVINDLIRSNFPEMKLPGQPVTGQSLIGRDTDRMSADQVMQILSNQRAKEGTDLDARLARGETIDDHTAWEPEHDGECHSSADPARSTGLASLLPVCPRWTPDTSELVARLLHET